VKKMMAIYCKAWFGGARRQAQWMEMCEDSRSLEYPEALGRISSLGENDLPGTSAGSAELRPSAMQLKPKPPPVCDRKWLLACAESCIKECDCRGKKQRRA